MVYLLKACSQHNEYKILGPLSTLLSFTKDKTLIVGSSVVSMIKEVCIVTGGVIRTLENPDSSKLCNLLTPTNYVNFVLERLDICDSSPLSGFLVLGSNDSRMRIFDAFRKQVQNIRLSPGKSNLINRRVDSIIVRQ